MIKKEELINRFLVYRIKIKILINKSLILCENLFPSQYFNFNKKTQYVN